MNRAERDGPCVPRVCQPRIARLEDRGFPARRTLRRALNAVRYASGLGWV